jgi:hypothetical protein
MNNNEDIKKQYDLLYEMTSKKLEKQVESLGSLDTKSSILLATVGVIFAGYLQLLTSTEFGFKNIPWLVVLELMLFISSGFFIFKAFMLSKDETWRDDPRPKKLLKYFSENFERGEYNLKDEITKGMVESYECNDKKILKKYEHLHLARNLMYLGIITLLVHLFYIIFC